MHHFAFKHYDQSFVIKNDSNFLPFSPFQIPLLSCLSKGKRKGKEKGEEREKERGTEEKKKRGKEIRGKKTRNEQERNNRK